jgi:hypothetical protein
MSDLTKSSKKLVREVYTYTFNENSYTSLSIGGNASVDNGMYNLYDKDMKEIGRIMFTSNYRTLLLVDSYQNRQCGIFLNNNNDKICISYNEITNNGKSREGTEISAKATYSSGKYKNKDVNLKIKFLKNSKRRVIITYKE